MVPGHPVHIVTLHHSVHLLDLAAVPHDVIVGRNGKRADQDLHENGLDHRLVSPSHEVKKSST